MGSEDETRQKEIEAAQKQLESNEEGPEFDFGDDSNTRFSMAKGQDDRPDKSATKGFKRELYNFIEERRTSICV